MKSFRLHPEADREGIEAAARIKFDDPKEAILFEQALLTALGWVCSDLMEIRCFVRDFRRIKIGKFRYSLVFRVRGSEIQILAIAHMSRKPGYWKNRAKTWPQ